MYKNKFDPKKQTITQELYGQMLSRDQVWIKDKSRYPRDNNMERLGVLSKERENEGQESSAQLHSLGCASIYAYCTVITLIIMVVVYLILFLYLL